MTTVDRYLFTTVLASTAVVLLVLLVLEGFFFLVGELEEFGEGGYGLTQVLLSTALRLPGVVYQTLPMALLVGGLLGVGGLAAGNELVALRAAGLAPARMLRGAALAALLLGVVALLIAEFVAPPADRLARQLRAEARGLSAAAGQTRGFWARAGHTVVKVDAVLADDRLAGVTLFTLAGGRLRAVLAAERASYADGRWRLTGVRESRLGAAEVEVRLLAGLDWQTEFAPATLSLLAARAEQLGLRELYGYIGYLTSNGLDADQYRLAFWQKLLTPLTNLTMLLVGLPFALGRSRQAGAGQRLLIGVLLGLLYVLLDRLLGNWVLLSGLPAAVGAAAPTGLFLLAALIGLRRAS